MYFSGFLPILINSITVITKPIIGRPIIMQPETKISFVFTVILYHLAFYRKQNESSE